MRNRRLINIIEILLICTIIWGLFRLEPVSAQDKNNLSLSIAPSIIELKTEKGKAYDFSIKLKSQQNFPIIISTSIENYNSDATGKPIIGNSTDKWTAKDWVEILEKDSILKPQQEIEYKFNMLVPKYALPGTYFAIILFQPVLPPEYLTSADTRVIPFIAAVLAVNVHSDGSEPSSKFLSIESFGTDKKFTSLPVKFETSVKNKDVYYHRVGRVFTIKNSFGNEVYNKKMDSITLLPETGREINDEIRDNLLPGYYHAKIKFDTGQTENFDFVVLPEIEQVLMVWIPLLIVVFILSYFERIKRAISLLIQKS